MISMKKKITCTIAIDHFKRKENKKFLEKHFYLRLQIIVAAQACAKFINFTE